MYYSAANCTFDIYKDTNSKRLRFVYALRVNASLGIMPYHSWRSRNVSKFINGNNIVEGAIILNANIPGYLGRIFSEDLNGVDEVTSDQELANSIATELDGAERVLNSRVMAVAKDTEIDKPLATLVTTYAPKEALEIARARSALNKKQTELNERVYTSTPSTNHILDDEYKIIVKQGKTVVDIIDRIRFTGKSFEITAGSSMNIKYAFPFVAATCSI